MNKTMNTKVLQPCTETYQIASRLFASGQLVAFPTETVYGLGANALDRQAVLSIFAAKGRPADNPLIVHIHHRDQLTELCTVPERALPLMDAFWRSMASILVAKDCWRERGGTGVRILCSSFEFIFEFDYDFL